MSLKVIMVVQLLCRIHDESLPVELNELKKSLALEKDEDTGNESGETNEEIDIDGEVESECDDEQCTDDDDDDDDSYDNNEVFETVAGASSSVTVR